MIKQTILRYLESISNSVHIAFTALSVTTVRQFNREVNILGFESSLATILILIVLLISLVILIARIKVGKITLDWEQKFDEEDRQPLPNKIDAKSGKAVVDMEFKIPKHHEQLFIVFENNALSISPEDYYPVNFDTDRAITYNSDINKVSLDLYIEPKHESTGSESPLKIVDKLNNRTIERIPVAH